MNRRCLLLGHEADPVGREYGLVPHLCSVASAALRFVRDLYNSTKPCGSCGEPDFAGHRPYCPVPDEIPF